MLRKGLSFLFLFLWASERAWTCPTCGGAQLNSPKVVISTALFGLIPLGLLGLLAWYILKDSSRRAKDQAKK